MWATGRARRCYSRWEVTPAGATCVGVLLAGGGIPLLPARAVGGGVDGPSFIPVETELVAQAHGGALR